MKYLRFILATAISLSAFAAWACGPYFDKLHQPDFLQIVDKANEAGTKAENLRLWQSQTSADVKLEDIEAVIYGDVSPVTDGPSSISLGESTIMYWYCYFSPYVMTNSFLNYLYNTADAEAINFIMLAKHVARLRTDRNSPWYYPANKREATQGYEPVISTILSMGPGRFYNRYSLQLIRAYFASGRYEECIEAFNERFSDVSDDDLMKRMSRDYVAGAALRLGNSQMATDHFAKAGDVESLIQFSQIDNAFELAALTNPDSPKLINFIDHKFNSHSYVRYFIDSTFVRETIIPVARQIVRKENVSSRPMWHYILAVGEGEFNNDYQSAYRHIKEAERCQPGRLADNIHAYRIYVEAHMENHANILENLRWLESKVSDYSLADWENWVRMMQTIVLKKLAPSYARQGKITTALQLANYAVNLAEANPEDNRIYDDDNSFWSHATVSGARINPQMWNYHDFGNAFFQFMLSRTPRDIENYIASLSSTAPLALYLNSRGYTNNDYLYDVAGTLYLANRDYANAVRVLGKISDNYQPLLNVDRGGYLRRDPFLYRGKKVIESRIAPDYLEAFGFTTDTVTNHKKLYFAREMHRLEQIINTSSNADQRGMARLKYSIGIENSYNSCWALTSYSRGYCYESAPEELVPSGEMSPEDIEWHFYLLEDRVMEQAVMDARRMQALALSEINSPEYAAIANHILLNYVTVARFYPATLMGRIMAAECDSWSDWVAYYGRD